MLIYAIRLTSWCSWGVLYPFLAVWLLRLGVLDEAGVGVVAGAAVIANRVGALLWAPLVHRHHKRNVIIVSQAAVIAMAGVLHLLGGAGPANVVLWAAAGALFGLANSVATLAQVSFIANQVPPNATTRAFSWENVALNIGAGIAPLLSSMVISASPSWYALAPVPFAVLTAALAALLPRDRPASAAGEEEKEAGAGSRTWPAFLVLNFLTLLAYAQLHGVFPAHAEPEIGTTGVGRLLALSSLVIVVCQVPLTWVCARFGERTLVSAANLVTAAGTALLPLAATGPLPAVAAVFLVTLGEMVYGPLYQSIAVRLAGRPAHAMGVLTFVWGVSESLAGVAGLALIGAGLGALSFAGAAGACLLAAGLALITPGLGARARRPSEAGV
ncbi:MFS transporter [Nonomuraea sp. NPDC004580]|uniref:MFS transporter n=1 Tax=Nonomuraea sp. NPDC004580 TaxID=3154552 RepID=UPI0033BDB4B4